jgi:hypothetical protein
MTRHPKCYGCAKRPAKKLNLPGSYGSIEMYCSLRCAARDAVEKGLTLAVVWSNRKQQWVDDEEQDDAETDDAENGVQEV